MKNVIDYFLANWYWISPVVFEVAARLFPTQKSLSIINGVKKVTDFVIPNRHVEGGTHP